MGKNHFPPPESSPRARPPNRPPTRYAPGNQRVQANPQICSKSRPSKNNPRNQSFNGSTNSNYPADSQRSRRDSSVGRHSSDLSDRVGGGSDQDPAVKLYAEFLTAGLRNATEVRPKIPEKFYSSGGESFAEVTRKLPVVVNPQFRGRPRADQIGKPSAHSNFPISSADFSSDTASADRNLKPLDLSMKPLDLSMLAIHPEEMLPVVVNESISNLDLDQDLDQLDSRNPSVTVEAPPILKESTEKENAWGAGSFVEVLRKPAPIKPPTYVPTAAQQIEDRHRLNTGGIGEHTKNSARNASSRPNQKPNDYQNQKRFDRKDRSSRTRGRDTGAVRRPNRKEHHSRGEESAMAAAKKKIRTPEQVEYQTQTFTDPLKLEFTGAGYTSGFFTGDSYSVAVGTGGEENSAGQNSVGAAVNGGGGSASFKDGIFHRRSFVDVVKTVAY